MIIRQRVRRVSLLVVPRGTSLLGLMLMLLFQGAALFAEPLAPGFYPVISEDGTSGAGMRVFEAERKADRVLNVDFARDFDLGLGKVENGIRFPVR